MDRIAVARRAGCGVVLASACALATSCREPGYRTEVTPTPQGGVELRRLPKEYEPTSVAEAPPVARDPVYAPTPQAMPPAPATDSDLAEVQSLWPRLSPADRKSLTDITRRLAQTHP